MHLCTTVAVQSGAMHITGMAGTAAATAAAAGSAATAAACGGISSARGAERKRHARRAVDVREKCCPGPALSVWRAGVPCGLVIVPPLRPLSPAAAGRGTARKKSSAATQRPRKPPVSNAPLQRGRCRAASRTFHMRIATRPTTPRGEATETRFVLEAGATCVHEVVISKKFSAAMLFVIRLVSYVHASHAL